MKSTSSFKRCLARVRRHASAGDSAKALAELDHLLESWPNLPPLLVLRAELIQLQDENGPPLEEAGEALRRAVELDEPSAEALVERGHFQFAVENDAKSAQKSFSKAVDSCKHLLMEALLGRAAALAELDRKREALFDSLAEARWLQSPGVASSDSADDLLQRWTDLSHRP